MSTTRPVLEPITIGGLQVKNRVMQLATRTVLHDAGGVTDQLLAFYEERAKGGVGSIVVEPLTGSRAANSSSTTFTRSNLGRQSEEAIAGLRRLVEMARAYDVALFGQLFHGGRQHHAAQLPLVLGPSPVSCPYSGGVPHVLDEVEIAATVAGFVDAAESFQEAGFHGVEVHGAQGHLIQQFLSPFSNRRTDDYGGSFDNRTRLMRDILDGILARCGADFPVGLRLATTERSPDGIEVDEAIEVAKVAVDHGVDYLSLSAGNFSSLELHIPDRTFPEIPHADQAVAIKEALPDTPVILCGRIITPENGDKLVKDGVTDVVGLSRPLICDPDWARKAEAGQDERVRCCISCNQCWSEITSGRPIRCIQNAAAGRELQWGGGTLDQVDDPKRVVVVGGGPAGMEAARVAAERGHHVMLFERSRHLGGSVARAATIPGHGEVGYVIDYLSQELERAGVLIRTGPAADVDAARILDELPHAVVLATGARHLSDALNAPPDFPVHTSIDVVDNEAPEGMRCVLFDEDGYFEAIEVAELVASRVEELTVVTRFDEVGRELPRASKISALRELDNMGARLCPTHWLSHVEGRTLHLAHAYSGRISTVEDVDSIIHVGGKVADDSLYHDLVADVPDVYRVGDAYMPRRIMDAVREGHAVGREI